MSSKVTDPLQNRDNWITIEERTDEVGSTNKSSSGEQNNSKEEITQSDNSDLVSNQQENGNSNSLSSNPDNSE